MKVKARVDFGGQYAMLKGTEADIPDNPVTRGLITGGFIEEVAESETPKLDKLKKDELLKLCEERGLKVDEKAKKEDLIKALEDAEAGDFEAPEPDGTEAGDPGTPEPDGAEE